MRSASLLCVILASSTAQFAVACDKESATIAKDQFKGLGRAEPKGFRWFPETQSMADQMRAHLMESYAQADTCLNGKPRTIYFYVGPKPIGQVGADGWFVPLDSKYDLPPRPGFRINTRPNDSV